MTDTNNTDGAALLPVTQAARDAAADFHHVNGFGPMQSRRMTADEMRSGRHDRDPLVKAFARFERDILARAPLPATQEDADDTDIALEIARDHPEGDILTSLSAPTAEPMGERVCSACDGESKGCTGEYRCLRCEGTGVEPDFVDGLDNRPKADDAAVARAARAALGDWLAWPDAARDGAVPVDNEQTISWLQGLPAKLTTPPTPDRIGKDAVREALFPCLVEDCSSKPRVQWQEAVAYVECAICGDTGPLGWTEDEAVAGWNARHRISHSLPGDVGTDAFEAGWQAARDYFQVARGIPSVDAMRRQSAEYAAALTPSPCPGDGMREEAAEARRVEAIALNQNDEMRQQLSHVGNMISDLARAMGVDQADADGGWPDLAGRIQKLIDAALTPSALSGDAGEGALRAAIAKIAPITVHMGEEYAEVFFADGQSHSTQAMTMNPQDWLDIQAAYEASHQGAGEP